MTRRAAIGIATWIALAACGGLESPDLEEGTVTGRVAYALPGAYVYPFGRPDLRASLAGDGGFSIAGVPVDTPWLVVVDGEAAGTRRAELRAVQVKGADRVDVGVVDASQMPLAATVVATVQIGCGAATASPRFSVVGTERVNVVAAQETAALSPIPAGTFDLTAAMDGFREARTSVAVAAGTTVSLAVPLEVDAADDRPGCLSTSCRNGLLCAADGWCYECLVDGNCSAGYTCDPGLHVCGTPTAAPGTGAVCEACTLDTQCAGGKCVPSGTSGYCSLSCTSADGCPAGFDCQQSVCVAPGGCSAYYAAFGAACFGNAACQSLKNGECRGFSTSPTPVAGYCTARCRSNADCIVWGYTCDAVSGLCTR